MILSHRGWWEIESEKNTIASFVRSFSSGFGTETDIRDFKGKLVISHDIANDHSMLVEDFFQLYNQYDNNLPLALNIKADGLQQQLEELIIKFGISNYFVFDMSIPDTVGYMKRGLNFFTRESEYEVKPSFYDQANGVWLDEFKKNWISARIIQNHLKNNKQVCIVSPELHKRSWDKEWSLYRKNFNINNSLNIHICTDMPLKAKKYFHE
ncbi:hypothetical protein SB49_11985 [Sediminicola sp. YIK13]|uniref:hypothetical protein n=1 Tax=Sediminicola sp. YIK13 TaxID=1453352 RepID=UPI0007206124|nr:hypothetical protein [Sediminicola sp. YIK13]ALM08452.1 hypothetical protein SB49_11985 [Sediminicola sp. YIK13]